MSLYRKYRPQTFADVVGQEHIVTTLEQATKQDKLAHAYLFAGSRGTGKTSVARILAKELMLRNVTDPKLRENILKGVEEGSIVDLLEIDAASNRGIDDIRDLIEKIQFSPVVAGAKVYIIDEVHMLTKEAFNALLKTLEEPPAYAHFILATTELNKIPATIQSRCQCFPFRSIREEEIIRRLQYIADQEHITIDREALRAIAHHVGGGMRDAISLLDQMRSLPKIGLEDVEQRIGGTGQEHVEAILTAIETRNAAEIVEIIRRVEESGVPLDLFLRQLLTVVRGSLHEAIEKRASTASILRIFDTLLAAIRDVRIAPVPGLVVESALLSLCTFEDASFEAPVLRAARTVTKKPEESSVAAPVTIKQPEVESASPEGIIEVPEVSLENIRSSWDDIVNATTPASVKMSLKNGRLLSVEGSKVVVGFSSVFHKDKVHGTDASRKVEEVMEKIFKKHLKLECVTESREAAEITPSQEAVNLAEAASEIF